MEEDTWSSEEILLIFFLDRLNITEYKLYSHIFGQLEKFKFIELETIPFLFYTVLF